MLLEEKRTRKFKFNENGAWNVASDVWHGGRMRKTRTCCKFRVRQNWESREPIWFTLKVYEENDGTQDQPKSILAHSSSRSGKDYDSCGCERVLRRPDVPKFLRLLCIVGSKAMGPIVCNGLGRRVFLSFSKQASLAVKHVSRTTTTEAKRADAIEFVWWLQGRF